MPVFSQKKDRHLRSAIKSRVQKYLDRDGQNAVALFIMRRNAAY